MFIRECGWDQCHGRPGRKGEWAEKEVDCKATSRKASVTARGRPCRVILTWGQEKSIVLAYPLVLGCRLSQEGCSDHGPLVCFSAKAIPEER